VTALERLGGEGALRAVVDRFVERMAADMIIGFFFAGKDLARIKQHEFEHAAVALGAEIAYGGRPIVPLHRAMRINGGQFRRRLALLRQELAAAAVPPDIAATWLAEQQRLQDAMTDGRDCTPEAP
jgi:hemoglobin